MENKNNKLKANFMKKLSLIILALFAIQAIKAQEVKQGNNLLSIGIGPSAGYWGTYSGGTPAIRLAFDHGFREVGPGTITLGAALGYFNKYYKSTYWDNNGNIHNYKWSFNYISTVFRAGYYYNLTDAGIPDMNVYGGLGMGLLFLNFHDTYDGPDGYIPYNGSNTDFLFNMYAGANYFFNSKTALYIEFGYDISYVTIGATFKLK